VKSFINVFKMQFLHMLSRKEFKISLTATLAFVAISFFELCTKFYGVDKSEVISSSYGWIGNAPLLDIQVANIFFFLIIFFVASLAFSDSQFVDKEINIRGPIITRCSKKTYMAAGAAVTFLGAFLVIFIPFVFSQLLSLIVFPVQSFVKNTYAQVPAWDKGIEVHTLFSWLFYNRPYLYNFIAIVYMSVCSGILALLAFAVSHYLKHRLLILCLPTLVVFVYDICTPFNFQFSYYLDMGGIIGQTYFVYFGFPAFILLASAVLLYVRLRKGRDEI
jgi:hypothetical protein